MTLLFGLLLLLGAGILAFSSGRTWVVEQRIANNEHQAIEASQAAQNGLERALAWLSARVWRAGEDEPPVPSFVFASGARFDVTLDFERIGQAICVTSTAVAPSSPGLRSRVRECLTQRGLFEPSPTATMPAPLVYGGCMTTPPQRGDLRVLADGRIGIQGGRAADDGCLPGGDLDVSTWTDADRSGSFSPLEEGASTELRRIRLGGCPAAHCAWNGHFALDFDEATALARDAGHVFRAEIPCGAAQAPGIYLVEHDGPIDASTVTGVCRDVAGVDDNTIGTPARPVLVIIPKESGCPQWGRDVKLFGILYFEDVSGCGAPTLQGASIHGAVIWEGDAKGPGEHSVFNEAAFGAGSELNAAFQVVTAAARAPGSWHDWEPR